MPIAAIVLAAGASTRLGQPKQLLRLDGETLLHRSVRSAIEAGFSPVVVVLGARAESMLPELRDLDVVSVVNENWGEGMASSLHRGLSEILRREPAVPAVLLMVCDQPSATSDLLTGLSVEHRQRGLAITACEYGGELGVPAIFSQKIYPGLLALTGDQGARRIIRSDPRRVASFPFPGGENDIDTPADAARLK